MTTVEEVQMYLLEYQEYIQKLGQLHNEHDMYTIIDQQIRDMTGVLDDYCKLNLKNRDAKVQKVIKQYNELKLHYRRASSQRKNTKNAALSVGNGTTTAVSKQPWIIPVDTIDSDSEDEEENRLSALEQQKQLRKQQIQAQRSTIDVHCSIVEERSREVNEVCADMAELSTLVFDMHHLVKEQGENLQRIEDSIIDTHVNVEQGHQNLREAEELQKQMSGISIAGRVSSWLFSQIW